MDSGRTKGHDLQNIWWLSLESVDQRTSLEDAAKFEIRTKRLFLGSGHAGLS
jgi:hypothetical protein